MAVGAASLKKTSWYRNIIILLGVEEHPKYMIRSIPKKNFFQSKKEKKTHVKLIFYYTHFTIFILSFPLPYKYNIPTL